MFMTVPLPLYLMTSYILSYFCQLGTVDPEDCQYIDHYLCFIHLDNYVDFPELESIKLRNWWEPNIRNHISSKSLNTFICSWSFDLQKIQIDQATLIEALVKIQTTQMSLQVKQSTAVNGNITNLMHWYRASNTKMRSKKKIRIRLEMRRVMIS